MRPDFPSLGDEIAEPRPDMNIKIAAFTVSEKSINICVASNNIVILFGKSPAMVMSRGTVHLTTHFFWASFTKLLVQPLRAHTFSCN